MSAPTSYYSEDGIVIYHGDCRDVLSSLLPGSVDLLLSDPPYGQQFHGQALITEKANIRADGARQGMRVVRQALFAAEPALKPDAHLLLFCHWESWPDFYDAVASYVPIKNALIWWKNRGGVGDTEMEYARDYEVVLYGARGRRKLRGKRPCAVLPGIPPVGADRLHPTEKPEALIAQLVARHSPEDGLTVDPFMGSGTTLVAAKRLGMKAVGVEIEERYCEIAAKRLAQGSLALGDGRVTSEPSLGHVQRSMADAPPSYDELRMAAKSCQHCDRTMVTNPTCESAEACVFARFNP